MATKAGFDPAIYQRIQMARRMELARLAIRRMQQAQLPPAAVASGSGAAGAAGGGEAPAPTEYVEFTVSCEYRRLEPDQQHGAVLRVNGTEHEFGEAITAQKGQAVELEVSVEGNDDASFTEWSNGEKTPAIQFTAGSADAITAYVVKIGVEENPVKVRDYTALEKLRDEVNLSGDCKEGVYYKQESDIDMDGVDWGGIGLKTGDGPDLTHTFKGVYDGNGRSIKNLKFMYEEGGDNELRGLFTSAAGAVIRNVNLSVNGFDVGADSYDGKKFGAGAIVGTTCNGLSVENCVASGFLGTDDVPCAHTTAGILANVDFTNNKASRGNILIKDCVSKVDIKTTRKGAGIVGFVMDDITLANVRNEGSVARVDPKHQERISDAARDEGAAGIVSYGQSNQQGHEPVYTLSGLTNTGEVTTNATTYKYMSGQIVGAWGVASDPGTNAGDIVMLDDDSMPLSKNINPNINGMNIFFGEVKDDGYIHLASGLENGGSYVYLFNNVNNAGGATRPPRVTLPAGTTVSVDCRFGDPYLADEAGTDLSATRTLVDGTDSVYRYTA